MRTLQTPQQPFNQTALSLWKIIEVMLTLASHKPRTVPLSLSKPLLSRFYYAVCSILPALAAPTTVVSLISPQWPSPTPGAPGATERGLPRCLPTCLPTLPFICILILTSSCTWLPAPLGSGFCQLQGTCNTPYEKKEAMFHPKHKHTQSCQSFPLHSWVALSTKEQVCLLNACIHICKYVHAQMLMYIKGRLN